MTDRPAYTRRAFLQTGLYMVSAATSVPTFLNRSAVALAAQADGAATSSLPGVPQDRVLVVVQLSGGNDGLNTVVPYGMDAYYKARPGISIPRAEVLSIDPRRGIGLHPSLAPVKELLEQGKAAIIQGVGYPNPNRSHFASMDIWHTADLTGHGLGWIGRAMDTAAAAKSLPDPNCGCITIGSEAPLAAQGKRSKPISFESANLFRWAGSDLHPALAAEYQAINRAGVLHRELATTSQDQLSFVMRTSLDAQVASDRIRAAVARGSATSFPPGPLANQLKMVAAMIRAELATRVYYVALGGFDTHAGQPNRHANLLREFAAALSAFQNELAASGHDKRVLTLAFSEFGRRVYQNASQGTDHGTAGPMFLLGDMVRPGLLAEHPSLDDARLDGGDMVFGVDFRSVYAGVLDAWMKIDSAAVLGQRFPPANVVKA